jgi:hypothetical protein
MSSHHIVRENQEPALLIMHAQAISFEKIQELLEWMPTVIVNHTEVNTVLGWGIKIDVVLVPAWEIESWRERMIEQAPVKLISFNPQDDPLLTAFYFLNASKASGVNVLLRHNSELNKIENFIHLDVEAFVNQVRWCLIRGGEIEKWYPAGTRLFVFPDEMKNELKGFETGELMVNKDGIVSHKNEKPFWLGEELF